MKIKSLLVLTSLTALTASLSAFPGDIERAAENDVLIRDRSESQESRQNEAREVRLEDVDNDSGEDFKCSILPECITALFSSSKATESTLPAETLELPLSPAKIVAKKREEALEAIHVAYYTVNRSRVGAQEIEGDSSQRKKAWKEAYGKVTSFGRESEIAITGLDCNSMEGWLRLYWSDSPVDPLTKEQAEAIQVARIWHYELDAALPAIKKSSEAFVFQQEEIVSTENHDERGYLNKLSEAVRAWDKAIDTFKQQIPVSVLVTISSDEVLVSPGVLESACKTSLDELKRSRELAKNKEDSEINKLEGTRILTQGTSSPLVEPAPSTSSVVLEQGSPITPTGSSSKKTYAQVVEGNKAEVPPVTAVESNSSRSDITSPEATSTAMTPIEGSSSQEEFQKELEDGEGRQEGGVSSPSSPTLPRTNHVNEAENPFGEILERTASSTVTPIKKDARSSEYARR